MTISAIADNDTILAIATGQQAGAIGLIRISGADCLPLLSLICQRSQGGAIDFAGAVRRSIFCRFLDHQGAVIDEGLATYFQAPHSYTGEDSAELGLHGNPLLLRDMLQSALGIAQSAGLAVRPARPGEFTLRAYRHGRLDLSRAEAVHRLITARSELELQASRRNFLGELSRLTSRFRSALIHLKAETEAEVDFADEDLSFESLAERRQRVVDLITRIDQLLSIGRETDRLRSGIQLAFVGAPNAGKSSLMNRMLGWDRSIVSATPGTTRDYVSEEIEFDGVRLRMVDTAGLRETIDPVEEQGVRLAKRIISESQIVFHVIDASEPLTDIPAPGGAGLRLHILNKSDLPAAQTALQTAFDRWPQERWLAISCLRGDGLEELRQALHAAIFRVQPEETVLLEDRHRFHFSEVRSALQNTLQLWDQNAPQEIVALEIDRALEAAGAITGRIDNEEVLGRIFSIFCIGK